MAKTDAARMWSLHYRLVVSVITSIVADLAGVGLDPKELLVLAELDEHPHPAEVAAALSMPKPSVTTYLKRLEAAGFVRRELDAADLRRHRLTVTPAGRRAAARGMALLSEAFGARLARLGAGEQAQLAGLLERLG